LSLDDLRAALARGSALWPAEGRRAGVRSIANALVAAVRVDNGVSARPVGRASILVVGAALELEEHDAISTGRPIAHDFSEPQHGEPPDSIVTPDSTSESRRAGSRLPPPYPQGPAPRRDIGELNGHEPAFLSVLCR